MKLNRVKFKRIMAFVLIQFLCISCERKVSSKKKTLAIKETVSTLNVSKDFDEIKQILKLIYFEYEGQKQHIQYIGFPVELILEQGNIVISNDINKRWAFKIPNFTSRDISLDTIGKKPKEIKFIEATSIYYNKKLIYRVDTDSFIESGLN